MITGAKSSNDLWDANDVARYIKASRSWVLPPGRGGQAASHTDRSAAPIRSGGREVIRSRSSGTWR